MRCRTSTACRGHFERRRPQAPPDPHLLPAAAARRCRTRTWLPRTCPSSSTGGTTMVRGRMGGRGLHWAQPLPLQLQPAAASSFCRHQLSVHDPQPAHPTGRQGRRWLARGCCTVARRLLSSPHAHPPTLPCAPPTNTCPPLSSPSLSPLVTVLRFLLGACCHLGPRRPRQHPPGGRLAQRLPVRAECDRLRRRR